MTKAEQARRAREEARQELLKLLAPGAMVYTIRRHTSASGVSHVIDLAIPVAREDGALRIRNIGWLAAEAMDYTFDNRSRGLKVRGGGMDMGYHLVHNLGRTLWPEGTAEPHGTRNGQPDRDGGYALKHEWL